MADKVGEVAQRSSFEIVLEVGQNPVHDQLILVLNWHHLHHFAELLLWVRRCLCEVWHGDVEVFNCNEFFFDPFLLAIEIMFTLDGQRHDVRGIPLFMESQEGISDSVLSKGLHVSAVESVEETVWIGQLLNDVEEVPGIALQGHIELGVDSFDLTIGRTFAEHRRYEELGQPVETFFEGVV